MDDIDVGNEPEESEADAAIRNGAIEEARRIDPPPDDGMAYPEDVATGDPEVL